MKPSDRIQQFYEAELSKLPAASKAVIEASETWSTRYSLYAIGQYLDEQAELDRRRRSVQWAVMFARSDRSYDHETAAHWLKQAGLDVPCPILHGLWWSDIMRAAEREGLL